MSGVVKLSVCKNKYTIDSANGETSKQLATGGGNELVAVVVTGGTGDIVVSVHDSAEGVGSPNQAQYFGANQGESVPFTPGHPILMKKGIYVQIEQGGSPFNGKVTLYYN